MKSDVKKILAEVHATERGEVAPSRVWEVKKNADGTISRTQINPEAYRKKQAREWKAKTEAAKIRRIINITQSDFANMLGVSLNTVRKWEQGSVEPSGAARTLLKIAASHPDLVKEAAKL